jgi:hypothetical protein
MNDGKGAAVWRAVWLAAALVAPAALSQAVAAPTRIALEFSFGLTDAASTAWTDPAPLAGESNHYVRVLQEDGETAWGTPLGRVFRGSVGSRRWRHTS